LRQSRLSWPHGTSVYSPRINARYCSDRNPPGHRSPAAFSGSRSDRGAGCSLSPHSRAPTWSDHGGGQGAGTHAHHRFSGTHHFTGLGRASTLDRARPQGVPGFPGGAGPPLHLCSRGVHPRTLQCIPSPRPRFGHTYRGVLSTRQSADSALDVERGKGDGPFSVRRARRSPRIRATPRPWSSSGSAAGRSAGPKGPHSEIEHQRSSN
jgi:hypothetical protein